MSLTTVNECVDRLKRITPEALLVEVCAIRLKVVLGSDEHLLLDVDPFTGEVRHGAAVITENIFMMSEAEREQLSEMAPVFMKGCRGLFMV